MTRSALARCLALVLAIVAGFGPGAAALAHGHAHRHLAEARVAAQDAASGHGHDHAPVDLSTRQAGRATDVVAAAGDYGDDHAHPRLDPSAAVRGDVRLDLGVAALVPLPAALEFPAVRTVTARLLTTAPPRAGPSAKPPPPSRAPPLG